MSLEQEDLEEAAFTVIGVILASTEFSLPALAGRHLCHPGVESNTVAATARGNFSRVADKGTPCHVRLL